MFKWIAGGVVGLFSLRYLARLTRAGGSITSRVRLSVHKVSLTGLELEAVVELQNPSPVSLSLQHPFVRIFHRERLLGSSRLENRTLDIAPNSQKTFSLRIASAGWLTLIQVLGQSAGTRIRTGNPISLELKTLVSTRVNGLPYEKAETIKLTL